MFELSEKLFAIKILILYPLYFISVALLKGFLQVQIFVVTTKESAGKFQYYSYNCEIKTF